MSVFFYSIKGGQGKTTHAVGYARYVDALLVTNDFENGTAEIYQAALPQDSIKILKPGQALASVTDSYPATPIVVDFGGWVESRVVEAARAASVSVVPLMFQSTADLMPAVKTVLTLQKYARRLVILINNTESVFVPELKEVLSERFPDIPIFVVNRSRYIAKLPDDGLTLFDLFSLGGLHAFALRNVIPQIKALYAHLDACETDAVSKTGGVRETNIAPVKDAVRRAADFTPNNSNHVR